MKKVLYLCLMVAMMSFMSCSSDDDKKDPIIGKWQLTAQIITEDGEITSEPITDCEKQSTWEFKTDGSLISEFYFFYDGACSSEGIESLIWKNNGNGVYAFSSSEGDEFYPAKITFSGNTFTMIEESEYDGKTIVYSRTYTRIN